MVRNILRIGLLVFFILFWLGLGAQDKLGFKVIGVISSETSRTENARATIYEDGKEIQVIGIDANGRFNITFPFNHDYTLVLSDDGLFPKKIEISAFIPNRVLKNNPDFPPFVIDQKLFTKIEGIDDSFSENTIIRLFYDPGIDNFISEVFYNDDQIQKQIDNAVWRSQQVGKTAEELAKLTDAELRLMRQEYDQWLKEAAGDYKNSRYQAALMGYKAASRLFPDEQFPKDRIAEINDLLLALQITSDLEDVQDEKYTELIKNADSEFEIKQYENAQGFYRQALNIKANDPYASLKIQEIDEILAMKAQEELYAELIDEADRYFVNNNFGSAKIKYAEALNLRPKEDYPKNRLKDIEDEEARLEKENLQLRRYELAMEEADQFRDKKQYLRARETYEWAMSFKPGDETAQQRIREIDELMKLEELDKEYNKLISDADKSFKKENYQDALQAYNNAISLKSEEEYPQSQVNLINTILNDAAALEALNQQYQVKIAEADNRFKSEEYINAKSLYSEALGIKSNEKYPKDKLEEINLILAELANQDRIDSTYNQLIISADNSFSNSAYQSARTDYSSALDLKPKEEYPGQKITEIDQILKNLADQEEAYLMAIAEADEFYEKEEMNEAKSYYSEASQLKPEESYPLDQISKIDAYFEEQARLVAEKEAVEKAQLAEIEAETERNYNQAIADADSKFENSLYTDAKTLYSRAIEIKPDESYAQQKIVEIENILDEIAENQKLYENTISEADKFFERSRMDDARLKYVEASDIKPDESYPVDQIAKIDAFKEEQARLAEEKVAEEQARLAQDQKETNDKYNALIDEANSSFNSGMFTEAKDKYEEALEVKPAESYPVQQIAMINDTIVKIEEQKKEYERLIAVADRQYEKEQFNEAGISYNGAKSVKPDESYPAQMILKIDSILNVQQLAAEEKIAQEKSEREKLEKEYNDAISMADNLFEIQNYQQAINSYKSAQKLKPQETYPKQKIGEAEDMIALLAKNEKAYNDAIANADKAFNKQNYAEAKSGYNEALRIKKDEIYPREQLKKIDDFENLLVQESQKVFNYRKAITEADSAFSIRKYNHAIQSYQLALTYKPEEKYPQQQIDLAERYMEEFLQQSKVNEVYDKAIAEANEAFNSGDFDAAETLYNDAMKIKPKEKFPRERLNTIVGRKKDIIIKERYEAIIAEADLLFDDEKYPDSRNKYLEALNVIIGDEYAQSRIDEIDAILAALAQAEKERKELETKYAQAIVFADKEFNEGGYQDAIKYYNEALALKSEEVYPAQQIEKIGLILENQKIEDEYKRLLLAADSYFRMKEYNNARVNYVDALDVKPLEEYPAKQIEKIDEILRQQEQARIEAERLAELAEQEEEREIVAEAPVENINVAIEAEMMDMYNGFIDQADGAFGEEEYNIARFYYFKAVDVRPDEEYPQGRIKEIRELLNARFSDRREKEYQDYVDKADQALTDGELAVARGYYNRALTAKPLAKYPKMQIEIIQEKLREILGNRSDAEYNSFISQGDKAFESKNYSVARYYYLKAQEINPSEEYPKNQIKKITETVSGGIEIQ